MEREPILLEYHQESKTGLRQSRPVFVSEDGNLFFLQIRQMHFCILQQLDHHLADVLVQEVMLQCGKRQETCPGHHMDAV